MGGEVYEFSEGIDTVFTIKHTLSQIYRKTIPISMLIDSQKFLDVITKASHIAEKLSVIDIAASREACNRHEILNVGLVLSEHNPADGLTKTKHCDALWYFISDGFDRHPVATMGFSEQPREVSCVSDYSKRGNVSK